MARMKSHKMTSAARIPCAVAAPAVTGRKSPPSLPEVRVTFGPRPQARRGATMPVRLRRTEVDDPWTG